jgi:membrane dipeptidase
VTRLTGVPTLSPLAPAQQPEGGLAMPSGAIPLAKEIDRVPSLTVPLDHAQEQRFQRVMEPLIMVDVHVHPMVLPEDMEQLTAYLRANDYRWGYQAVKHGGWTAVATANFFRGLVHTPDLSMVAFEDVLQEVGLMLSDLRQQADVVQVKNADDIEATKQQGLVGFLPTLEHLAIGQELHRVDILGSLVISGVPNYLIFQANKAYPDRSR